MPASRNTEGVSVSRSKAALYTRRVTVFSFVSFLPCGGFLLEKGNRLKKAVCHTALIHIPLTIVTVFGSSFVHQFLKYIIPIQKTNY